VASYSSREQGKCPQPRVEVPPARLPGSPPWRRWRPGWSGREGPAAPRRGAGRQVALSLSGHPAPQSAEWWGTASAGTARLWCCLQGVALFRAALRQRRGGGPGLTTFDEVGFRLVAPPKEPNGHEPLPGEEPWLFQLRLARVKGRGRRGPLLRTPAAGLGGAGVVAVCGPERLLVATAPVPAAHAPV